MSEAVFAFLMKLLLLLLLPPPDLKNVNSLLSKIDGTNIPKLSLFKILSNLRIQLLESTYRLTLYTVLIIASIEVNPIF